MWLIVEATSHYFSTYCGQLLMLNSFLGICIQNNRINVLSCVSMAYHQDERVMGHASMARKVDSTILNVDYREGL